MAIAAQSSQLGRESGERLSASGGYLLRVGDDECAVTRNGRVAVARGRGRVDEGPVPVQTSSRCAVADNYRHGAWIRFAALEIATGQVTAALKPRNRHQEFLAFLTSRAIRRHSGGASDRLGHSMSKGMTGCGGHVPG